MLVAATGQLNRPHVPDIAGLDDFAGHQFHSARWDHDHDLTGRDVAVIGIGASAIQFVPEIAKQARSVTLFQRSEQLRRPQARRTDLRSGPRRCMRRFPVAERALPGLDLGPVRRPLRHRSRRARALGRHGQAAFAEGPRGDGVARAAAARRCPRLPDRLQAHPDLERLVPDAAASRTSRWSPTPRARRRPTASSRRASEHPADTIIFGTGFQTHRVPRADADHRPRRPRPAHERGATAPRPTSASPSPASRTCSCSTGRTPTSATTRSSSCSSARSRYVLSCIERLAERGARLARRRARGPGAVERRAAARARRARCGRGRATAGTRPRRARSPTTGRAPRAVLAAHRRPRASRTTCRTAADRPASRSAPTLRRPTPDRRGRRPVAAGLGPRFGAAVGRVPARDPRPAQGAPR